MIKEINFQRIKAVIILRFQIRHMETLYSIKTKCKGTLDNFHTLLKEKYQKDISTEYFFVPQFINDTNQPNNYANNKSDYFSMILSSEKIDLDELVNLIHKYQNKISWVDFMLCPTETNISVYVVNLVCLNKIDNKLNFHISCPI